MNKSRNIVLLAVALILGVWATCELRIHAYAAPIGGNSPDVIVGDMPSTFNWGTDGVATAYSVATTSCNIGDVPLTWISNTPAHPVIGQNLYRVKDGRIEQLGQSWLKHGFFALQGNVCGSCSPHPNGSALGVGCSDPYGANLNGQQGPLSGGTGGLGPRSQVNASNGVFTFPPRRLTSSERGTFGGRIRVLNSDLNPAQNSGAVYFVEAQYVQPEDAQAGNDTNNASYRRVLVSGSSFNLNPTSTTMRMEPAINAWQSVDSEVDLFNLDIADDGRVIVGVRTTQPEGGGYHTEIAIENLTSHQSVRALTADCCAGAVSSPGFNDVDYHAEGYSGTDWAPTVNGSEMEWATETFAQNQDANAIRWGTMYSFWFDSESHPAELTLGLFRAGAQSEVTIMLKTPAILVGDVNLDGVVDLLDVSPFINLLSNGGFQKEADINGDGFVNLLDVSPFIALLAG